MNSNKSKTRLIHFLNFVLFLALAALPCDVPAQEQEWLASNPSVARLQGKLIKVRKFGRPSYGENPDKDETIDVPILILQSPVRVKARSASSVNNESLTNISFVQAIFSSEMNKSYAEYLDKRIVLAGTLDRGHKGEHFTDMVMQVKA